MLAFTKGERKRNSELKFLNCPFITTDHFHLVRNIGDTSYQSSLIPKECQWHK